MMNALEQLTVKINPPSADISGFVKAEVTCASVGSHRLSECRDFDTTDEALAWVFATITEMRNELEEQEKKEAEVRRIFLERSAKRRGIPVPQIGPGPRIPILAEKARGGKYVYFVSEKDAQRPIKIGYSTDVPARLAALQTAVPFPLEVLLVIEGGYVDEENLHCEFGAYRLTGEWFKRAAPLLEYINDCKALT